jgi:subtilisin family serine protease
VESLSKRQSSVVLLALAFAGMARASPAAAPVDERIFAGKRTGETASVLVVMREQADLSAAEAITDPEERRRFVFEALRTQAEISQRPLVERLGRSGLRYRSFYLVNMLEVEADRSLADELARRADVSSIAANLPSALRAEPVLRPGDGERLLRAADGGQEFAALTINSPANIAGVHGNTARVAWAPIGSGFTGDVAYVGRGCPSPFDSYLADPAGKVALIDRDSCAASLKVDRAAKAGAIGVLIGLVDAGDPVSFSYGGGDTFVPTLVIVKSTADLIKANLAAPVNVTLAAAPPIEPNLTKIRAPDVWAMGFTGQGIVVGVADTGLTWDHPALKPRYRGFDGVSVSHHYNWHDAVHDAASGNMCGSDSPSPCDDDTDASGHGTATSGLIVGDEGDSRIGVAPGAELIACRNMDAGVGTPARYAECFEFFLAPTDRNGQNPRPDLGAHVINNSWGCYVEEGCTDPDILKAVVENTRAAGVFVVASAGNDGPACGSVTDPPALYEATFSVGAITLDDAIAEFSSRGPVTRDGSGRLKPDVVAPGFLVLTSARPSDYQLFSGTSAASPHVAGAVALLWSAVPSLRGRPSESADVLRRTATPLTSLENCGPFPGSTVPNAVFGWGRIDIEAAVAIAVPVARMPPQPPASPRAPRALRPRAQ